MSEAPGEAPAAQAVAGIDVNQLMRDLRDSAIRHAGTTVAGALVTLGALAPNQAEQAAGIITSLLLWGVVQVWSFAQKAAQHRKAAGA